MEDYKLLQFIQDKLSEEEENDVLDWIEKSDLNREKFNNLKNLWTISGLLNKTVSERSKALSGKVEAITGAKRKMILYGILKYAAIIILTFTISGLVSYNVYENKQKKFYNTSQKVIVPSGQRADLTMSDGTVVSVNSGSIIEYPHNFSAKNRHLFLKGEALFQVSSDAKRPFIVTVNNIDVVATGTCFNIDSYSNKNYFDVTLIDGTVELFSREGELMTHLNPNENARISLVNDEIIIAAVDPYFYTSWKDGFITFSDRRLEDIAYDLERWFNVKIIFARESSKDIRYSGTILKNKPIDQILEILKLTSDFVYDIHIKNDKSSVITIK